MNVICSNYSNNSIALIQWAYENALQNVHVCYVDTGWSGKGWLEYVEKGEQFAKQKGFEVVRLTSRSLFEDLMEIKGGFPSQKYQWCALHLKGIPFLQWIDKIDPENKATILMARRASETGFEKPVAELVENSEYHGDRKVWHPLYGCSDTERNELLERVGFKPLAHRSLECNPCINSSIAELRALPEEDIAKTEALEEDLGAFMYDPERCQGAKGIREVVKWAKDVARDEEWTVQYGCSAAFGCGI